MRVQCVQSGELLGSEPELVRSWNQLAGEVPFRRWDWHQAWWQHYGTVAERSGGGRLWLPAVFDDAKRLVGLAPWFLELSTWRGRVVRFLGTQEVCPEYLGVLARPGSEIEVAGALASWLVDEVQGEWDLIDLDGVDGENATLRHLVRAMKSRECLVHIRPGSSCWRLELPTSWEEYLLRLSRSHRKQVRRHERLVFQSGRAIIQTVETDSQLHDGQEILASLHQKRQLSLGNPGCFASRKFTAFHDQLMCQLLRQGRLWLFWIELDGRAIAAEYAMIGDRVVYFYQGGFDPDKACESPGGLATMAAIKLAIEHGYQAVDFLRGNEPYKARWRAMPRPCPRLRIVAPHASARLRHGVWNAARTFKKGLGAGLEIVRSLPNTSRHGLQ